MTVSLSFDGTLAFASPEAAFHALLQDDVDGYLDQSAFRRDDLTRDGAMVSVAVTGTFPARAWETSKALIHNLSRSAIGGIIAARVEDDDGASEIELIGPDASTFPPPAVSEMLTEEELQRRVEVIRHGAVEALQRELDAGMDVHWALQVMPRNVAGVALLLDANASIHGTAERRPLVEAAEVGVAEIVQLMLARGADPNLADETGAAPLGIAASLGKISVVELLLAAGANVEHENGAHGTALQWALRFTGSNRALVVEALLRAGADVNATNERGETTRAVAKLYGRAAEIEEILKKLGAEKKRNPR